MPSNPMAENSPYRTTEHTPSLSTAEERRGASFVWMPGDNALWHALCESGALAFDGDRGSFTHTRGNGEILAFRDTSWLEEQGSFSGYPALLLAYIMMLYKGKRFTAGGMCFIDAGRFIEFIGKESTPKARRVVLPHLLQACRFLYSCAFSAEVKGKPGMWSIIDDYGGLYEIQGHPASGRLMRTAKEGGVSVAVGTLFTEYLPCSRVRGKDGRKPRRTPAIPVPASIFWYRAACNSNAPKARLAIALSMFNLYRGTCLSQGKPEATVSVLRKTLAARLKGLGIYSTSGDRHRGRADGPLDAAVASLAEGGVMVLSDGETLSVAFPQWEGRGTEKITPPLKLRE